MKLSYSRLSSFMKCPKLYSNRYIDKFESKRVKLPLEFGTVFHEAIEAMYAKAPLGMLIHQAIEKFKKFRTDNMHEKQEEKFFKYLSCLTNALTHWYNRFYLTDVDKGLEVIHAEKMFEDLKIINPRTKTPFPKMTWRMVPDMIAKLNGDLWLFEYKTKTRLDSGFYEHLEMNQQVLTYLHYCRQVFKIPIRGVKYRIFKIPNIRQGKREDIADFYKRMGEKVMRPEVFVEEDVIVEDDQLREFHIDHAEQIKMITYAHKSKYFPKNTEACLKDGVCEYLRSCMGLLTNEFNNIYRKLEGEERQKTHEISKK